MILCSKCNLEKSPTDFYAKSGRQNQLQSYCKQCNHTNVLYRQRRFKSQCVEYKGGSCESCGYSKCIGALEFHHKDPSQKDFTLARAKLTSWVKNEEKIKKEIDKCILLCANCHREKHSK